MVKMVPACLQHRCEGCGSPSAIRVEGKPRDDSREFSRGFAEPQVEPGLALEPLWNFVPNGVEEFVDRGGQVLGVSNRVFVWQPVSVRPSYQELWDRSSYDEPEAPPRVRISCPVGFMTDLHRAGLDGDFHVAKGQTPRAGGDSAARDRSGQRVTVAGVSWKSAACQAPEGIVFPGADALVFERAAGSQARMEGDIHVPPYSA